MVTIFDLDHLGAKFQVKLTDCISGDDIDIAEIDLQAIVFYKPDGTSFEKTAFLSEEPAASGNFFITYTNGNDGTPAETETILDLIGKWEFAGKVKLNNDDTFQTSARSIFWVS